MVGLLQNFRLYSFCLWNRREPRHNDQSLLVSRPTGSSVDPAAEANQACKTRTGASGYVGGQVLHALQEAHPEYDIAVLVRDSQKGEKISQAYPKLRIVLGDLDSTSLIDQEVHKADIIVSKFIDCSRFLSKFADTHADAASAQNIKGVEAIGSALKSRDSTKPGKPFMKKIKKLAPTNKCA